MFAISWLFSLNLRLDSLKLLDIQLISVVTLKIYHIYILTSTKMNTIDIFYRSNTSLFHFAVNG